MATGRRLRRSMGVVYVGICAANALLLISTASLWAQTVTGTINGRVIDPSGAVIPGTEITVTNQETGTVRSTISNSEGVYNIPQLPSGKYSVEAKISGFSSMQVKDIVVNVGSDVRIDLKLQVGGVSNQVTVSEALPTVETSNSDVSHLMDEFTIRNIPLNARDLLQLAEIQAGVQFNNFDNFGKQLIVSGSRGVENRFLQEGVDTTFTFRRSPVSSAGIILGVEAVREFKVMVGNYGAEYGEHVGGVVNTLFKSGTNSIHGSGYGFFRNSVFDARNFFDPGPSPPDFKREQFGGSLGGPIKKDKTFIFANYEGYRHSLGLSSVTTQPNDNTRAGRLPCGLITVGSKPAPCTAAGATKNTLAPVTTTPFISGVMQLLMPKCNGPAIFDAAGGDSGTCYYYSAPVQTINEDFYLVKLDHTFNAKHSLSSSYNFDASTEANPGSGLVNYNPNFTDDFQWRKQIFSLQETWVASPTLVNTARLGVNRTWYFTWQSNNIAIPRTIAGSPVYVRTQPDYTPAAGVDIFPQVTLSGIGITSLAANNQTPRWLGYTMFSINDDVNYLHGKHAFQFGFAARKWYDNTSLADGNFKGAYTFNNIQNFLAGTSQQISYSVEQYADFGRNYTNQVYGLYGQDIYKLLPNLTFTMGLRWEYEPPTTERYGRVPVLGSNSVEDWSKPNLLPTALGAGNSMYKTTKAALSPRFGFNWDPFKSGKTSVRGGASIMHDLISSFYWYYSAAEQYPFTTTVAIQAEPWPYNPALFDKSKLFTGSTPTLSLPALFPSDATHLPTKYGYNLEIQRELPGRISLLVGYVGAQARHVSRQIAANTFFPIIQAPGSNTGCDKAYPNPFNSKPCGNTTDHPLYFYNTTNSGLGAAGKQFLPNSNFNTIGGAVFDSNTSFNSLQVVVDRHMATGLNFRFNYTHNSCITDASDFIGTSLQNGGATLQYTRDHKSSRMPCTTSAADVSNFNLTYAIPFGNSLRGVGKAFLSGWQIGGLTSLTSGIPLDISLGFNNAHSVPTGNGTDRPDLVPGSTRENCVDPGNLAHYIKASCFSIPVPGYFGNLGAGYVRGPGYWASDLSLKKTFGFGREGTGLELKFEVFNAFNHTNFRAPTARAVYTGTTGTLSSTFGQIVSTQGTSRQMQLGARFQF